MIDIKMSPTSLALVFYDFIIIQKEHHHETKNNFLYDSFIAKFKVKLSPKCTLHFALVEVLKMLLTRKKREKIYSKDVKLHHLI